MELLEPKPGGMSAIAERHGSRRVLIACNETARACGLTRMLDAATALSREPTLQLIDRSKRAEHQALQALSAWAEQFSSHVTFDSERWMLWLEIGASIRYFGALANLRARIAEGISRLRYTARLGVAPTLEGAALLALCEHPVAATSRASLEGALRHLPLDALALDASTRAAFRASGLKHIGEVLCLPPAAVARRFGPEASGYVHRLLGEQADPRKFFRAPQAFRRQFEFTQGVESVEGLLFALRRMLHELQGFLRGRDTALQSLQLTLKHREAADTVLTLRMSSPHRDALHLFALLREKLERIALPAAITHLVLGAGRFVPLGFTQKDLFEEDSRRDADWTDLLDKLRARLGDDAVRYLGLADDHRPEKAWCVRDRPEETAGSPTLPEERFPDRPLWLFDPKPIDDLPAILGTPERIETGWWEHADSSRDYYLARTNEGARWWLYREAASRRWFLQGLWA